VIAGAASRDSNRQRLRLGKLDGYSDLYESPFLARVPKV